jgi:4-amino-4-deoxy-L-arabinose transferase-like glycosyltransferase
MRGAIFWLFVFAAGSAAALVLVRAGPFVRYQHYDLPGLAATPLRRVALVVLALQLALVLRAVASRWRSPLEWLGAQVGFTRLALVAAAVLVSGATLILPPALFAGELLLAAVLQLTALASLLLAAASLPPDVAQRLKESTRRLLGPATAPAMLWRDPVAWAVALFVTIVSFLLAVFAYQRHPHVPDEVGYLLSARYFAAGKLWLPSPPLPAGFDLDLMMNDAGRWFSPTPPGWPAVLAIGVALGVPWLVNPVLSGVGISLTFALVSALYGRQTARLSVLLLALSPWYLLMGMNLMTHAASLAFALAAIVGALASRQRGGLLAAFAGGLACGVISLIRPLEAVAAGVAGALASARRPLQRTLASWAAFGAGAAITGALNLGYNVLMTGNARTFPIMRYVDVTYGPGSNDMGFGANRGLGWGGLDPFPGHSLRDVFINMDFNVFAVNDELFGWSFGSITLLTLFLLARRGARTRVDYAVAAAGAVVIVLHAFYWFSGGPDFGARYWYLIVVPCVILTARGAQWLDDALPDRFAVTRPAIFASAIFALVIFVLWRGADKYYHYRGMRPDVRALADSANFGRSLVLVRGRRHPDYASAATYNPLDLHADAPIYAWDRSDEVRQALIKEYPDRPVWILDGPTRTHGAYRIVAGPLPAGAVPPGDTTRVAPDATR